MYPEFQKPSIERVLDLQRRLNEYDTAMFQYMVTSSSMTEHERQIAASQKDYASFVDELLSELGQSDN
jgi:hypothetical protein